MIAVGSKPQVLRLRLSRKNREGYAQDDTSEMIKHLSVPTCRYTLVEEQRDVVGGELRVGLPAGAGSDGGEGVFGLIEILEDGVGEMAEVGAVPLDDKFGSASLLSLRHGAGFAGVLIRRGGFEALGLKKLCNLMLDGLGREGLDALAEVCDGEEQALILDYSDADDIQVGVEEVGAVRRAGHPALLDCRGCLSVTGDVLGDGGEAGSGVGAAGGEVGLAGILVAKVGVADDPAEMVLRGDGQGAVPAQGRQVVLGSSLIGELQKSVLGVALRDCGWRVDGEHRQKEYEQQRVSCGEAVVVHALSFTRLPRRGRMEAVSAGGVSAGSDRLEVSATE